MNDTIKGEAAQENVSARDGISSGMHLELVLGGSLEVRLSREIRIFLD